MILACFFVFYPGDMNVELIYWGLRNKGDF